MKYDRYICGVDPGTENCGWCILTPEGKLRGLGVIRARGTRPFRLSWIHERMTEILQELPRLKIDLALERAFVAKNPATAIVIGEARGVILAAAGKAGARVFDYSPMTAKKAMTGKGNATKEQVAFFASRIFKLEEIPELDATDACALAFCRAAQVGLQWTVA